MHFYNAVKRAKLGLITEGWARVLGPTYSILLDAQTLKVGWGGRALAQICILRWGVRRVCAHGGIPPKWPSRIHLFGMVSGGWWVGLGC